MNTGHVLTISKKELRLIIGMNNTTFSKRLTDLEPAILAISPRYNKLTSLLTPKEVRFIIDDFGIEEDEFIDLCKRFKQNP